MIIDTENIPITWTKEFHNEYISSYVTQFFPNFGYGVIQFDGHNNVYWIGLRQGASHTYLFNTRKCEDISLEKKKKLIADHLQKLIEANFGESKY